MITQGREGSVNRKLLHGSVYACVCQAGFKGKVLLAFDFHNVHWCLTVDMFARQCKPQLPCTAQCS